MESHYLRFAYSEVGHPGTMNYRRGLLYYIKSKKIQLFAFLLKSVFFNRS